MVAGQRDTDCAGPRLARGRREPSPSTWGCAMVCAMVLLGVKPARRAFGEFSPTPTPLAFSGRLRAKTRLEGARPTGFEPVTFGFVDRPLVLRTGGCR